MLKEKFFKEIAPKLKKEMELKNILAVPKVEKIVINTGIGRTLDNPKLLEGIISDLTLICGQKPIITPARKAISGFKIKKGDAVGLKVTLRGNRMYDFLEKLINITMPRIRDFRGVKVESLDKNGNLNFGVKEHTIFPEMKGEKIQTPFGLQVTIVTTAKNPKQAQKLFESLGMIFEEKQKGAKSTEKEDIKSLASVAGNKEHQSES